MTNNNSSYPKQLFNSFLQNKRWKEAREYFDDLMNHPVWWVFDPSGRKVRLLSRPGRKACSCPALDKAGLEQMRSFLKGNLKKKETIFELKSFCRLKHSAIIYTLKQGRNFCGAILICHFMKKTVQDKKKLKLFEVTINSILEEVHKDLELDRLYKTLRPRAVALSTVHTIHRIIGSTMTVKELLPKVARLSLQILKIKACIVSLYDNKKKRVVSRCSVGTISKDLKKRKDICAKVIKTGAYYRDNKIMSVPLLNEEILGCITIYDKIDDNAFSVSDQEILHTLAEQTTIAIENARLYEEQQKMVVGTVRSLVRILDFISPKTYTHLGKFVDLVMALAKELKLPKRELNVINYAAVLHDAGEVGVSNRILKKADKLNQEEVDIIRGHPAGGVAIIEPIKILKPVIPLVLHHHERFDGQGYPDGLKGKQIPIGARIMAVADAFEAMISDRTYRDAKDIDEALDEIKRCRAAQFDPEVVDAFIRLCDRGVVEQLLKTKIKKKSKIK